MTNKITLITPPDIYENSNFSVLFINLNEKNQELASVWLSNFNLTKNLNFYIYSGEPNIAWLLHSLGASNYTFIDLDNLNVTSNAISGYVIGKSNVYYKTEDESLAAIYSHINTNRVSNIEDFLVKVISE